MLRRISTVSERRYTGKNTGSRLGKVFLWRTSAYPEEFLRPSRLSVNWMRNLFERRFEYVRKKSIKQNISRTLKELDDKGLIECLTPEKITWKKYVLTDIGKDVLNKLAEKYF